MQKTLAGNDFGCQPIAFCAGLMQGRSPTIEEKTVGLMRYGGGDRATIIKSIEVNPMLTIQIPQDLEQQLTQRAAQVNLSLETFILEALQEIAQTADLLDTPKAEVLAGFQRSLEDVKAGRISPIETLWDNLDD